MKYRCEDEGGETREYDMTNPGDAAVSFCEDTIDNVDGVYRRNGKVEDLPSDITVTVTDENDKSTNILVNVIVDVRFEDCGTIEPD